jgi:hypothetical protein
MRPRQRRVHAAPLRGYTNVVGRRSITGPAGASYRHLPDGVRGCRPAMPSDIRPPPPRQGSHLLRVGRISTALGSVTATPLFTQAMRKHHDTLACLGRRRSATVRFRLGRTAATPRRKPDRCTGRALHKSMLLAARAAGPHSCSARRGNSGPCRRPACSDPQPRLPASAGCDARPAVDPLRAAVRAARLASSPCHECDHAGRAGATIAFGCRGVNATTSRRRSRASARVRGICRRSGWRQRSAAATPSPSAVSRPSSGCVASDAWGGARGASAVPTSPSPGLSPICDGHPGRRKSGLYTGRRRGIAHS